MFGRRKNSRFFYLSAGVLTALLAVNQFLLPLNFVVNAAASGFLYPVLLVQRFVVLPTKRFFKRRESYETLEQAHKGLQQKYRESLADNVQLRASSFFCDQISELVDFKKRYDFSDAVTAQVIFKQFSPEFHFFLIDKGVRHGVRPDDVVVHKNFLIGRVTQVYPLYSKLTLVTDKSCKVAAYCSKTGASGIHVGANDVSVTMLQRVSHLSSVQEGDLVISSGEGLVFPQGFGLGRIKAAMIEGLSFSISVDSLVNLREINYCVVMHKGESDVTQSA